MSNISEENADKDINPLKNINNEQKNSHSNLNESNTLEKVKDDLEQNKYIKIDFQMKEITKKLIKEVNRLIKKKRKEKKIIPVHDNQNKIQEYTKSEEAKSNEGNNVENNNIDITTINEQQEIPIKKNIKK